MSISPEELRQRQAEVLAVKKFFSKRKDSEKSLTQAKLCGEMDVGEATYSQWMSLKRRIPDKRFIYLAKRLGFDALSLRPELMEGYFSKLNLDLALRLSFLSESQRRLTLRFIDWIVTEDIGNDI